MRHDLGEYYTPDWLADHVLNEVGYVGDPDKRLLDPACGSGTFLVMAINRVKHWFEENRERCSYDEGGLCEKILGNVVGFDLNPLAVMAARTNYLVAIRDIVGHVGAVEIPVYLCDSVMTPAEYGDLFSGGHGKTKELKTAVGSFLIPAEITTNRQAVAKYTEQLEFCVQQRYSAAEFLARCADEGILTEGERLHVELYNMLCRLARENRNSVWARIIKNAFAPLFLGRVDYVVGNPPWVNWESLPKDYRESTLPVWDKYRLRERTQTGARLGNVKKELSALFLYAAADHYLTDDGTLGFVITQSIFKSGANEGFRRFALARERPLLVEQVSDLSLCLPFDGAINRTATIVVRKGRPTRYPVPYKLWVPKTPRSTVPEEPLEDVLERFSIRDWLAAPVEPSVNESTWLTAEKRSLPVLQQIVGDRSAAIMDRTYAGSCTWLNGVFWAECLRDGGKTSLIRNMGDVGRKKVESVTVKVESDVIYPLLRGRDVRAWRAAPSAVIAVAHSREDYSQPVQLSTMKTKLPLAYSFFLRFENELRSRSGYKQLMRSRPEFYGIGNVGNYTLAPHKVVFKDLSDIFQCAVVGPLEQSNKPVIPDHTVLFLVCKTENEAHFVCGLLNSIPARVALYGASVGVQTQRYFPTDVSRVKIPSFDSSDAAHKAICKASRGCHSAALAENLAELARLEEELAGIVAPIWSITSRDIKRLASAYREICGFRRERIEIDEENE